MPGFYAPENSSVDGPAGVSAGIAGSSLQGADVYWIPYGEYFGDIENDAFKNLNMNPDLLEAQIAVQDAEGIEFLPSSTDKNIQLTPISLLNRDDKDIMKITGVLDKDNGRLG